MPASDRREGVGVRPDSPFLAQIRKTAELYGIDLYESDLIPVGHVLVFHLPDDADDPRVAQLINVF
jgi:hypothetical protein